MDAEQVIAAIVDIRAGLIREDYQSEAAISDGVVRRLIEALGWPPYETQIVFPQFPIEARKVDFALCHPRGKPVVLLEVKNVGMANEKGERQLFEYCFHRGVPIAVLTDGRTWKMFYPAGEGSYTDRLFCGMDLIDGDEAKIANGLIRYLAYSAVKSGEARRRVQEDCKAEQQQRQAATQFSSVWNKLLLGPDPILVELFEEKVEAASGFRPARQNVVTFIKKQRVDGLAPPVTKPRPGSLKSSASDPGGDKGKSAFSFTLHGQKTTCKDGKELMSAIFIGFAERDETFCERFAERVFGRRRKYVARSKKDLYPDRPDLLRNNAVELPGGWWLGTHAANSQKMKLIRAACELARIKFGHDIIVCMPTGFTSGGAGVRKG